MRKTTLNTKSVQSEPVLPNFLIVGAAKSGTTSLYHYLKQHPDIFMSSVKEPKFFSARAGDPGSGPGDALRAQKAVGSFADYCKLFQNGFGKKAVGEASVDTLFYFERSIPVVQRYLGDPRIIILLRDPTRRAYSAYQYQVRDGFETLSFKDALIAEEKRKRDGYKFIWQYREGGLYARPVRLFQEQFSRVLVLLYDDLQNNPTALLRSVFRFLEVNPDYVPNLNYNFNVSGVPRSPFLNTFFIKPKRLHKIVRTIGGALLGENQWIRLRESLRSVNLRKPRPMDPEIENELRRFYRTDILALQDLIRRDLSAWLYREQE